MKNEKKDQLFSGESLTALPAAIALAYAAGSVDFPLTCYNDRHELDAF